MGDRYLVDLADVCRRSGRPVVDVDGWQTRSRGSGGYDDAKPDHVMVHHTASPPSSDGWPDVEYCTFWDDDAPLCNLYLDRAGTIYVCAAGATNTNGAGSDPCRHIADDTMNTAAIGIEAGNDGRGERWPAAQLDAYVATCAELCAGYAIPTGRIHAHAEWAPARKTDPAGPDRYAAGAGTWTMDAFRADCAGAPPPTVPVGRLIEGDDDEMRALLKAHDRDEIFILSGNAITWAWDYDTLAALYDVGAITSIDDARVVDWTTIQHYIDHCWTGGPVPAGYRQP